MGWRVGHLEVVCGLSSGVNLSLTLFLIFSSRYRNLLGAVLPPVPAALCWHADIQPPAGLHRVAHHSGGPAGLRPFRLLPDCIFHALEGEVVVYGQKMGVGGWQGLSISSTSQPCLVA